jgi:hypothetical protein
MRRSLTARNVAAAFSALVLMGLALTGAAYAITSAAFRYPRPKTGYLMIPAPAFVVGSRSIDYGRNAVMIDVIGSGCFVAPVNLPQGAKMTQLAMWYTKNDAAPANLYFFRASPAQGTSKEIAHLDTANTGGAVKLAAKLIRAPSLQTVNNVHFTYSLAVCLSDAEVFRTARIRYTYTSAGD